MRQNNIARLAEVLEPWSGLVRLQRGNEPTTLFAIATQVDGPPRYKSLFQDSELPNLLGIDPLPLVDAIKEYLLLPNESRDKARLQVPEGITLDLLQHLSSAWGDISERTFQRNPGRGTLTLCIGMSALHFFISGSKPFSEILKLPVEVGQAVFKPINKDE
eukprot:gene3382-4204_t